MAALREARSVNLREHGKTINLTEEEEDEIVLDNVKDSEATVRTLFCLTGKLLTTKTINSEAMRRTFHSIWKLNKGFGLKQWPNNIFVFQFYSIRDKEKVIKGSPWTFDNYLLVLKDVDLEVSPAEMIFDKSPFWIRVMNVPIGRMTKDMASVVGRRIGHVIEIDEERLGGWSRFLRIRVEVEVGKPLKRGVMVRDNANQKRWLNFQYERLGSFCYLCGIIGHQDQDCELDDGSNDQEKYQYGEELRASPLKIISRAQRIEKEKEDALISEIRKKLNFNSDDSNSEQARMQEQQEYIAGLRSRDNDHSEEGVEVGETTAIGNFVADANGASNVTPGIENSEALKENPKLHGIVTELNESIKLHAAGIANITLNKDSCKEGNTSQSNTNGKKGWKRAARVGNEETPKISNTWKRKGVIDKGTEVDGMEIDEGVCTKKQKDGCSDVIVSLSADSDASRVRRDQ